MKILLPIIMMISLTGCTLFSKTVGTDSLQEMAKDVLDEDQGLDIEIKPIPKTRG